MPQQNIYTIGYAVLTPHQLVATLRAAGVTRLADVRANPVSRKQGFSKSRLVATLGAGGIEYSSHRGLGIPTADRKSASSGAGWSRLIARYRASLDEDRVDDAAALADDARSQPTVVMCLEEDIAHCHRTPLAEWISERTGMAVKHL